MWTIRDRRGFTLVEICVVLFLAVMLISIALPSLTGQLARRRLQEASDHLDALATQAREHAVTENRPYLLIWEKNGSIALYPADSTAVARNKAGPVGALTPTASSEHYTLLRNASLTANPASEWMFWPTGNCEPVSVRYQSSAGEWEAAYNPLSGRGTFNRFVAQ